jgi:hypothetical protein
MEICVGRLCPDADLGVKNIRSLVQVKVVIACAQKVTATRNIAIIKTYEAIAVRVSDGRSFRAI